jgi:hypothetical protein
MKGDKLPGNHHVLRFIGRKFIEPDGEVMTIQGGAFLSRPRDDNMTSYNWLEYFDGDAEYQVEKVREHKRLRHHKNDMFAKLNVGAVLSKLRSDLPPEDGFPNFDFLHDPLESDDKHPLPDESHSLMINVPEEEQPLAQAVGDLIAECILESFYAIERTPPPAAAGGEDSPSMS